MSDRGLAVAVTVLAIILLVLLATVTIQKGVIEKNTNSAYEPLLASPQGQLVESGSYSLQQAFALCKRDAIEKIGDRLLSLSFDADSSRFLQVENAFEVFLDAHVRLVDEDQQEFVVCKVAASTNKIIEFSVKSVQGIWGGM